jgi:hypothetical protein
VTPRVHSTGHRGVSSLYHVIPAIYFQFYAHITLDQCIFGPEGESVTDLLSYHVTSLFTYVYVLKDIVVLFVDVAGKLTSTQNTIHPPNITWFWLVVHSVIA